MNTKQSVFMKCLTQRTSADMHSSCCIIPLVFSVCSFATNVVALLITNAARHTNARMVAWDSSSVGVKRIIKTFKRISQEKKALLDNTHCFFYYFVLFTRT